LTGDEPRYLGFANNLLHGYYSTPAPDILLWNGPGYPLILAPFLAFHSPLIILDLLNAVFYYLSVVFLFKTLITFVNRKLSFVLTLIWAFYFNIWHLLQFIATEIFTAFLITSFIYSITLFYTKKKNGYLVLSGLILGYLALTKIIFGFVFLFTLFVLILVFFFKKTRFMARRAIFVILIAFAITTPYLIYTFNLTGKFFYWADSGGMSLYWMSTPYSTEYGDWKGGDLKNRFNNSISPMTFKTSEGDSLLKANHKSDIQLIAKEIGVKGDDLFKKIAYDNIKKHPFKFLRNYFDNISRMLFDFPYSYSYQVRSTEYDIFIGSFYLWGMIICSVLSIINWKKVLFPVKFTLLIIIIYLLCSCLASAYQRQFDILVPVILFWMGFVVGNLPRIQYHFKPIE
jgi:4-amino-4-deoxy-L-arabinose transferase-like glycosyltransferase